MKNLGYILNLSTNYNANNYLYYFLPSISSGRLLLFEKLTQKQLPTSKRHKEIDLKEKINHLKNHWDLYRLNPNNKYEKLKINIVIDYEPWEFTGFGRYSAFTFSKIHYLRKEFEKRFTEYDLSKIVFQYFVIKNKAEDLEEFIQFLDEKNAVNNADGQIDYGKVKRDLIAWPSWDELEKLISQNHDVSGRHSEEPLNNEDKLLIDEMALEIESGLIEKFEPESDSYFNNFLTDCIQDFKNDLRQRILKIGDLNNISKKKEQLLRLLRKLSSEFYLRQQDVLFRFTIDSKTNNSKIYGYESLTALLAESIDFFGQDNPAEFVTNGNENRSVSIQEIIFDEEKTSKLFGRYQSFYNQVKSSEEQMNENKIRIKQFKFTSEIDPSRFFKLDERMTEDFLTVKGMRYRYLGMFNRRSNHRIRKELEENTIQPLEDYIKSQSQQISQSYNLDGDYGLSENYEEMDLKQIKLQLDNIKRQEESFKLSSSDEPKKYSNAVNKFNMVIGIVIERFMDSLRILPHRNSVILFFPLVLLLVLLFGMPLFRLTDWFESFIYSIFFIILLSISAVSVWFLLKSEVNSKFKEIYLENVELLSRFQEQVTELSDISVNVRKSTLRRKNIKELNSAKQTLEEEQRKYGLYAGFYKEITEQIRLNGHSFGEIQVSNPPDVSLSPLEDIRNKTFDKDAEIEVRSGTTEKKYQKIEAQLGIIKLIKSR